MSQQAQIQQMVNDAVAAAGHGKGKGDDSADVTQLKRENTGLRNRVKELEERVTKLEAAAKPATVAKAGTASASGKAHDAK